MRDRLTALLLRHMPKDRDDRVSRALVRRGVRTDTCCPAHGSSLPRDSQAYGLMVIYGGVQSANDDDRYLVEELDFIEAWLASGRPLLGLCLGAQLMARVLGARVYGHPEGLHEIGYVEVHPSATGQSFLPAPLHVYHWHREGFDVPEGAQLLAVSDTFPNQAIRYGDAAYGLQFHPEVTREMSVEWMAEAGHMLDEPGAHSRERQVADGERYDEALGAWLEGFIDRWLDRSGS